MVGRVTFAEIDAIRAQPQRAVLLYLTDRCPAGCQHCSVAATATGPRPDRATVERLVDELCGLPHIRMVGISGGEPFTERVLLQEATGRLAAAGKLLVLYTSGLWGRDDGTAPRWAGEVLARASCVVLSTDQYHAARIPERRYLAALRAARSAGCWIGVQVLGTPGQLAEAERLLAVALGPSWPSGAEIRATEFLPRGRAATAIQRRGARPGHSFGRCPLASSPVIRHDGRITACCNEDVVTGGGPAALQAVATSRDGLRESLARLRREPFLRAIGTAGVGALSLLPDYRELGTRSYPDICSLCWALLDRHAERDPAVTAMSLLSREAGDDHERRSR
jgi:hypothetical protein